MNSVDFLHIHDIALADTLEPNISVHYRSICRWYSKEFHTPLHVVENDLPPAYVLRHYYESQMGNAEEEKIDSLLFKALNPDIDEDSEEEIQEFISMVEQEQESRLKKSNNKQQSIKSQSESSESSKAKVLKTYNEPPPPEADSNPDSLLDSKLLLGDYDDDSDHN